MKLLIIISSFCVLLFNAQAYASEYPTENPYATKSEMKRMGDELRGEIIDSHETTISWWLEFTALFLAVVVIVAGGVGVISIQNLKETTRDIRDMKIEAEKIIDYMGKQKEKVDEYTRYIQDS